MRLSAALIVRDEADHLRRCLTSVRGVVDEIVVVDTGSTDASVEVAESFDAVVLHREWDGDFSVPRNLGLDHVTGDWVLYIDADEQLAPTTRAHVERELADPDGRFVAKRLKLQIRDDFTPFWEHRLWRHRPDIRFRGVIHESHLADVSRIVREEGLEIGDADLLLTHAGYEGDLTRKHQRNLPLLERQVEHQPDRTYLWAQIGRSRRALGDPEGAWAAWRHGVDLVRRNGVREPADCLVYVDLLLALAEDGRPDPDLVAEADATFGAHLGVLWAGAVTALAVGDHAATIERIDRLLALDTDELARAALTTNVRLTTEWALNARGVARFQLGDHEGAAADFAAAIDHAPDVVEYRLRHRLAVERASRQVPPSDPAGG